MVSRRRSTAITELVVKRTVSAVAELLVTIAAATAVVGKLSG